jgi:PIN domain nuclease of toxin-antitoxin system
VRALVDTHILLWWGLDDPRLTPGIRDFVANASNQLFWSAASSWEVAIKYAQGRLPLPEPPERFILTRLARYRIQSLPILDTHAFSAGQLPGHHRDPFDRLLVAQGLVEGLAIVTSDPVLGLYGVRIID